MLAIYTICIMALDYLSYFNLKMKGIDAKVFNLVFFDNNLFINLDEKVLRKSSLQKSLLCALNTQQL